ncbi:MAG: S4 domain-containing protein, partial [Candidatus Neomarinimicrobiota bacterium]|nr:S4 domain-containing protein [Candidatus Neomarinimicrobiota bacterium]
SDSSINPRDIKRDLARDLVSRYYDDNKAKKAEDAFDQIFIKKDIPDNIPTLTIDTDSNIIDVLVSQNLVSSKGEAKRLIAQNAVKIDGEVCSDPAHVLKKDSDELVIKVGKRRFLRVLG